MPHYRSNSPFDYIGSDSDSSESSTLYSRFVNHVVRASPLQRIISQDDQSSYTIHATASTDVCTTNGWSMYSCDSTENMEAGSIYETVDMDSILALRGKKMRNDADIIKANLISRYGKDISFVDGENICEGRFAIYHGSYAIARNFLFLYDIVNDGSTKFVLVDVRGNTAVVNPNDVAVFFIPNSIMLDRYFARISENIENGVVSSNIDAFLRRLSESYPDRVATLNLKKCSRCGRTTA